MLPLGRGRGGALGKTSTWAEQRRDQRQAEEDRLSSPFSAVMERMWNLRLLGRRGFRLARSWRRTRANTSSLPIIYSSPFIRHSVHLRKSQTFTGIFTDSLKAARLICRDYCAVSGRRPEASSSLIRAEDDTFLSLIQPQTGRETRDRRPPSVPRPSASTGLQSL